MKIAVASGKGGTGKTTVSINLYFFIAKFFNKAVLLVDCDVEEPNDALFFPGAETKGEKEVFLPVPEIDPEKCTFCKKCSNWCGFNAISIVKALNFAGVNADLCHSCGACLEACSFGAIREQNQTLGQIKYLDTGIGLGLTEGRLKVGSSMQTSLIKKVKKETNPNSEIVLFDAPPGTSCPVVETVADADYVILVAEPTPFGLHDLKITVELLLDLQIPFGVIINKAGLGNRNVYEFLVHYNIDILAEIPFDKSYARKYASGDILENIPVEIEEIYKELIQKLELKLAVR
ncbi:nucleotide-binding protein [Maribellus maritimus]|uniref:nucleotide-binding protein n=1 Tax=Maribellus maritimus TaxID=2870838 RepID=UPI001EEC2771|nr:ATP-binding protein [Maribellus maritimus]MCG6190871.1 ATP-binding protein [Maribellus maritimus]